MNGHGSALFEDFVSTYSKNERFAKYVTNIFCASQLLLLECSYVHHRFIYEPCSAYTGYDILNNTKRLTRLLILGIVYFPKVVNHFPTKTLNQPREHKKPTNRPNKIGYPHFRGSSGIPSLSFRLGRSFSYLLAFLTPASHVALSSLNICV